MLYRHYCYHFGVDYLSDIFCLKKLGYIHHRRSYRVSGFRVSKHAVKQMRYRGVTKSALRYNLKHKPLHTTGVKYNKRGRLSYIRYSRNKVALAINPRTNNINTTWKYHTKLMNRFLKGKK